MSRIIANRQFIAGPSLRRFARYQRLRVGGSLLAVIMSLAATGAAHAQSAAKDADIEQVVVSASRITASGFQAPTPTTVLAVTDLEQTAMPNLFDTITQLPSLAGSTGVQAGTGGTSSANNGLSSFNQRGLGTIRTLTLIDGQRVVPANTTGVPDISEFPQLFVQHVDVVTGGASASWGSDAVGGVVNFITDKRYNGVKGNIEGGMSTFGDDTSALFQVAAGTDLLAGKAHIEASAEFYHNDGVHAPDNIGGALTNGRCCNLHPLTQAYTLTTTPAGVPENNPIINAQNSQSSEWGLITAPASLKGISFDANGNPTPFQFGTNCVGTICQGGDLTDSTIRVTVEDPITRSVFYTRLSYNISSDIEVYGTYSFGNVFSTDTAGGTRNTGITIQCGNAAGGPNAYLAASINAACVANKITSFTMARSYDDVPNISIRSARQMRRYVLGTDGTFNMFDKDWTFDTYIEHGENDTHVVIQNEFITANLTAAIDAVAGPNGQIQCRNPVAAAAGCVPIDIFGGALSDEQQPQISQTAAAYIAPHFNGPYSTTAERQEAASMAINGTPFKDWAGDVALAFGAEYREEAFKTTADPYSDGVTATNPFSAAYPNDPLINAAGGSNWFAGNFHHGSGNYHVAEGFVEFGVPLLNDDQWGKANLDLAGRATDYSTSGYVSTWKVGVTWDTPLQGVRLRALQSRDVRAPNLQELFAAPTVLHQNDINRLLPANAPTVSILVNNIGNPGLSPETAATTEVGIVYQPDFLPGFNASVDYYRVGLKKGIGTFSAQQEIDLCQVSGNANYCPLFNFSVTPATITVQPFNIASQITDGFDIETSYQFDLQNWGVPGSFVLRGLATHVSKFIANSGVPGAEITENAGTSVPLWKGFLTQSWTSDPVSFNLTERVFSEGVIDSNAIVCQAPNCPVPTVQHPTYSNDSYGGFFYLDIGGSYQMSKGMQAYFKVNNVTNLYPGPLQAAAPGFDPVGRLYLVGFRFDN